MTHFIRFLILATFKIWAQVFYRCELKWVGRADSVTEVTPEEWQKIFPHLRLIVLLNHTSLFEPLYISTFPFSYIWKFAGYGTFPGADITMKRPIVGRFFKILAPKAVTITRKRDHSWTEFLDQIEDRSIVSILPEGRMKRSTGLDKYGRPMTVRSGIVDIMRIMKSGGVMLAYSGGLHHVHTPGNKLPRLFKTIRANVEIVSIEDYLASFDPKLSELELKRAVVKDLEARRDRYVPESPE